MLRVASLGCLGRSVLDAGSLSPGCGEELLSRVVWEVLERRAASLGFLREESLPGVA